MNQGKAENARIERTEASKIVCDFVLNRLWDETDKLQARIDQKFGAGYSQDRIRKNARAKDLELQAYENSSSDIPPQSVDREVKDCVDAALQGDSSVGGVSKSEIELACRLMLQ